MKKFNKLGAALLAACMICSFGTTVFAAGTDLNGDTTSGNTQVTATTTTGEPAYTVTIPSTIPVGQISKTASTSIKSTTFEVKASDVADLGSKQVNVSISTADGSFKLSDGSHALPYQVFNVASEGTALASGDLFASFTEAKTVTGRVDIDQANIEAAGEYTGTLTFTIALVNVDNPGSTIGGITNVPWN